MSAYFAELYSRMAPLVGNRVFPVTYPQEPLPTWPAIRYTPTGGALQQTSCGDAMDGDVSVQIDVVALKFVDLVPLVAQVRTSLDAFSVPCVLDSEPGFEYDAETKTHRAILQYTIAGSTTF